MGLGLKLDNNSHILLIEDEVITAMSLVRDLKNHGYVNTKFVLNGQKAIESVQNQLPDLIIADVSLSGGESGLDLAVSISSNPVIPVIMTTGYEQRDLKHKLDVMNNFYFIRKPVQTPKLIKLIESL